MKKRIFKSNNFTPLLNFAAFNFENKEYHIIYDFAAQAYYCDLDVSLNNCLHVLYLVEMYGKPTFNPDSLLFQIENSQNKKVYVLPLAIVACNETILSLIGENYIYYTKREIKNSNYLDINILDTAIALLQQNKYRFSPTAELKRREYTPLKFEAFVAEKPQAETTISINNFNKARKIISEKC